MLPLGTPYPVAALKHRYTQVVTTGVLDDVSPSEKEA